MQKSIVTYFVVLLIIEIHLFVALMVPGFVVISFSILNTLLLASLIVGLWNLGKRLVKRSAKN